MSSSNSPADGRGTAGPPVAVYDTKPRVTTYTYSFPDEPELAPAVEVRHDRRRHRLRVTGRDGTAAEFDDRPVRFLVMAPDPRSKALRPVLVRGEPVYHYLCPEVPPSPEERNGKPQG